MSVVEAQQRIAELSARLQSLAPAAVRVNSRPLGAAAAAPATSNGAEFANTLQKALSTASVQTAGGTAAATATPATAAGGSAKANDIIATARQYLGVPYVWGGASPNGFDCSGLLQYVFDKHGIDLPRVSKDQARAGVAVSPADARPGDIVAFDNTRSRAGIDHIGLYIGDGKWIAAPKTGDVVKIQDVDLSKAAAIRRVIPEGAPALVAGGAPQALSSAPSWAAGLPSAGKGYVAEITAAAKQTGVDPRLLASVAWSESNFSATAKSGAGAIGLMQLMPATARGLGVDPTNPAEALVGGGRYLAQQLQNFGGRVDLALAAYNAGPGAVRKHGGVPPYDETQTYVRRVLDRFQSLGGNA